MKVCAETVEATKATTARGAKKDFIVKLGMEGEERKMKFALRWHTVSL